MAIRRLFGTKKDTVAGGSKVTLPAPTGVTATPSASGGTLAAGNYYYRVTFLNAAGETVGSAEVTATTTGSTSSVSINWTTNPLATSARVYRGTASGQQATYYTDADGVGPFVDTGAAGTAGTVPTLNTARITIPDADDLWPVTNANVDRNVTHLDRNEEITGFRGNPVPEEFRKDPRVTVTALAYPRLLEILLWYAMGAPDVVTGTAPAARTHLGKPIGYGGSGVLPALFAQVIRDDQIDRVAGCYVNSVTVNFSLDGHATVEAELWGLYHKSENGGTAPVLTRHVRDVKTLKLRDLRAYFAGSPVIVPGVTGFSFTFNNNLVDDSDARFAAGQSIDQLTDGNGVVRRIWYPDQHFLGGSQTVSGEINFATVQQAEDVKHDLAQAEQLVAEVEGRTLATTPVAKEMMRFTVKNAVRTGGGADALTKEGLQNSSYEYGGFIGADGTDVTVESVNDVTTAIT
jgi:hypothetical protein